MARAFMCLTGRWTVICATCAASWPRRAVAMRLTPCMVWEFGWDHARARKAEMAPALGLGPWRDIGGGFVPATCRHRLFQTGGQYPWLGRDGLDNLLDGSGGNLRSGLSCLAVGVAPGLCVDRARQGGQGRGARCPR